MNELGKESPNQNKWNIVWINVIIQVFVHIISLYGLLCFFLVQYWTILWAFIIGMASLFGVTAGAHRLWSHRTYKAKWQLRLLLMIFQTVAFQGTIYDWARDHRVHHKFTDSNADPYTISRGFFFSHIGWLLLRKHPDVLKKGATVPCSDLKKDAFVVFQRKYYFYLVFVLSFIVPTLVPWLAWNESLWYSGIASIIRFCITLHVALTVNSVAHRWGIKPYNNSISSVDNAVIAVLSIGEGWHNYHHAFPWDYKTAEFGSYTMNSTTAFIDFFAFVGWAYDRKTVPTDMVKKYILRNTKKERVNNKTIKHKSQNNIHQIFEFESLS